MQRRIVQVEPGLLRIEQRLRVARTAIGTDVSGPACIYAEVRVRRGSIAYLQNESRVPAPERFALFMPPFAIVQAALERCEVTSVAVAFRPSVGDPLPAGPVLLAAGDDAVPLSSTAALGRGVMTADGDRVARAVAPPMIPARAKALIDRRYGAPLAIGRVAERLNVSPAVLSRTFRRTYGMPPVAYRHHVRVMDALLRFAEGAVPAGVFQDVGFDDLSRFYAIFRKVSCAAPGSYRLASSRNAKT